MKRTIAVRLRHSGYDGQARIRALRDMTVPELRAEYARVFGEETRSRHKDHLWRQIAWRLQADEEGDLSERGRHLVAGGGGTLVVVVGR